MFTLAVRSSSAAPDRSAAAARMLLFVRVTGSSDGLYVVRTDGSDLRRLAPLGPAEPVDVPRWSPDGSRIAFEGRHEVFVVSLTSSRARQVTKNRRWHGFNTQPA